MLRIKDCLFNKDEIEYIKPDYNQSLYCPYVIYIQFKDDNYEIIYFDNKEERDAELSRILEKVEKE